MKNKRKRLIELYAATQNLSRKEPRFTPENGSCAHISQIAWSPPSCQKPPPRERSEPSKREFLSQLATVPGPLLYSRLMRLLPILSLSVMLLMSSFPAAAQTPAAPPTAEGPDYSGMYSFLKEGEFMQITLEDKGKVSGFISRYGDSENNQGTFLDQFIKSGSSNGNQVSFTTESIHGVRYTFAGTFERGPGKKPQDEGYYILRGTLTREDTAPDNKGTVQKREVEFRSFPRDADTPQ